MYEKKSSQRSINNFRTNSSKPKTFGIMTFEFSRQNQKFSVSDLSAVIFTANWSNLPAKMYEKTSSQRSIDNFRTNSSKPKTCGIMTFEFSRQNQKFSVSDLSAVIFTANWSHLPAKMYKKTSSQSKPKTCGIMTFEFSRQNQKFSVSDLSAVIFTANWSNLPAKMYEKTSS
jgi:putative NADPH-quinone reductase